MVVNTLSCAYFKSSFATTLRFDEMTVFITIYYTATFLCDRCHAKHFKHILPSNLHRTCWDSIQIKVTDKGHWDTRDDVVCLKLHIRQCQVQGSFPGLWYKPCSYHCFWIKLAPSALGTSRSVSLDSDGQKWAPQSNATRMLSCHSHSTL